MRSSGGQPGHEGKTRELAAPGSVERSFESLPRDCTGCGHRFDGTEERLGDPLVHQKWELPQISPLVYEYRLHRLCCPACAKGAIAELPAGVSASAFGPRLEAHIAILAGVYRLSRRQVQDVVREIFAIPISLGAVDATIMRMSRVLADPWAELREAIGRAEAIHADETTWRLRGAQQWLWLAASALVACYRIDPSRSQAAAKELIGEDFGGFVISDRYAAYHFLDVLQQQLCWSHAIRQFIEVSEREGAPGKLGSALVKAAREVFGAHRAYLEGGHELAWLAAELAPHRERIRLLLEQGQRGRHKRTKRFCAGLLEEFEALWTFCEVPRIDPSNNAAERALRHAVIMRKTQLGTQSDRGSRWIERICSVRETCRLQGRSPLTYLIQAAGGAHGGTPAPSLVPP
jgi:transposase